MKHRPCLFWDRDGRGRRSLKLGCRRRNERWYVCHIGQPPLHEEHVLRNYCVSRWPRERSAVLDEQLATLRRYRNDIHRQVRQLTVACGWSLRGYKLYTGTIRKSQRLVVRDTMALARLRSAVGCVVASNQDMLKLVDERLADLDFPVTPRQRRRLMSTRRALERAIRRGTQSLELVRRAHEDPRNAA